MAIHTDTISYARGLWLLWNSDRVEISLLAKTEQEVHVTVKVCASNFSWLFYVVHASPRFEKRAILWNNLSNMAELQLWRGLLQGSLMNPFWMMTSMEVELLV